MKESLLTWRAMSSQMSSVEIRVCASGMRDGRMFQTTMKEILIYVNALFNSDGGKLSLQFDFPPPYRDIKRRIEEQICRLVGEEILMYNVNIFVEPNCMEIIISTLNTNEVFTLNYNLYLPGNEMLIHVASNVPVVKIRNILNMNIHLPEPVQQGSHCKEFKLDNDTSVRESKLVQFKLLKTGKQTKSRTLAQRLIQMSKLLCYVSAYANYAGGHIYFGIDDNGIVRGQQLTPQDQAVLQQEFYKAIRGMKWPENCYTNGEKRLWEIYFEPVKSCSGEIVPSTYVIVIYVAQCPGGVFTKEPESYYIREARVVMMDFLTWKEFILKGLRRKNDERPNLLFEEVCNPSRTETLPRDDVARLEKAIKNISAPYDTPLISSKGRSTMELPETEDKIFKFEGRKVASTRKPPRLNELWTSYMRSIGHICCGSVRGTCFLVTEVLVITNYHVYKMIEEKRNMAGNQPINVLFDHLYSGQTENVLTVEVDEEQDPNIENPYLNYKFFRLKQNEGLEGRVSLGPIVRNYQLEDGYVVILGHPQGQEMQYEVCNVFSYRVRLEEIRKRYEKFTGVHMTNVQLLHVIRQYGDCLWYDTTFFHGSSGSPVFDMDGNIVAMHTSGFVLEREEDIASEDMERDPSLMQGNRRGVSRKYSLIEFGVQFLSIYRDIGRLHGENFVKEIFPNYDVMPNNQHHEARPSHEKSTESAKLEEKTDQLPGNTSDDESKKEPYEEATKMGHNFGDEKEPKQYSVKVVNVVDIFKTQFDDQNQTVATLNREEEQQAIGSAQKLPTAVQNETDTDSHDVEPGQEQSNLEIRSSSLPVPVANDSHDSYQTNSASNSLQIKDPRHETVAKTGEDAPMPVETKQVTDSHDVDLSQEQSNSPSLEIRSSSSPVPDSHDVELSQEQSKVSSSSPVPEISESWKWKENSEIHQKAFIKFYKYAQNHPNSVKEVSGVRFCCLPECCVGRGAYGTRVFVGLDKDGSERAVKRLPKDACSRDLAEKEVEVFSELSETESNHVLKYWFFDEKSDEENFFLILDLCEETLKSYVKRESLDEIKKIAPKIIWQILKGLADLHRGPKTILHRDLKPENILRDVNGKWLLADFGISRILTEETTHISNERGTQFWRAVESYTSKGEYENSQPRYKATSDIQVAGMLAYYIVTKGKHPFGEERYRLDNLLGGKPVGMDKLEDPTLKDLLTWMLSHDPKDRPSAEEALKHPYLQCKKQQFKLLCTIGSQHEVERRNINSNVVQQLTRSLNSISTDWRTLMNADVLKYLCTDFVNGKVKTVKYDSSWKSCLRLMRNTEEHCNDQPRPMPTPEALCLAGDLQESLAEYFLKVFPDLPVIVHRIVRSSNWKEREDLREFFK